MRRRPAKPNTTIQIDHDGTQAGIFNASGDAQVSFMRVWLDRNGQPERLPLEWILHWPTPNGPASHHLGITGTDAVEEAVAKAQEHLRTVGFTRPTAGFTDFGADEPSGW